MHIKSLDAEAITAAITAYLESKSLGYRRLIGQGYDGASPFCGKHTGVKKRICTVAGHAIYMYCSCHRLQLASIQAAESVPRIQKMFGMMTNLWKLFFFSPRKVEKLKEVQAVLNLPEIKS